MKKKKLNKKIIQGRWYKINKKIERKLVAKYHKIKDWKMDPKGYFLIGVDRKKKIIQVGYCKFTRLGNSPINDMVAIVKGKTAIEIVNTLIREKFIYLWFCRISYFLCSFKLRSLGIRQSWSI